MQVYIFINFLLTIVYALLHSKADYHSCASFRFLVSKMSRKKFSLLTAHFCQFVKSKELEINIKETLVCC